MKLCELVFPGSNENRWAPMPDEDGGEVVVGCGVLACHLDDEYDPHNTDLPEALWCLLRSEDGDEWWCRADFIFPSKPNAEARLASASADDLEGLRRWGYSGA